MNAIPGVLAAILLLLAVAFFVIALVLMVIPYDIQRKLENFDAYKAEFEEQWGVVEESDVQRVSRSGNSTPSGLPETAPAASAESARGVEAKGKRRTVGAMRRFRDPDGECGGWGGFPPSASNNAA
jgi:hypothetical protein